MSFRNPLAAVVIVGVMQLLALVIMFAWYAIRDRYTSDCDHGAHHVIVIDAQVTPNPAAPLFGRRTAILYRCKWCPHVETKTIEGVWTLAQIRAWGNGIVPDLDWEPAVKLIDIGPDQPEPDTAPTEAQQ